MLKSEYVLNNDVCLIPRLYGRCFIKFYSVFILSVLCMLMPKVDINFNNCSIIIIEYKLSNILYVLYVRS